MTMTEPAETWEPGDRVALWLPDKALPHANDVRVSGTVTEVDRPGTRPGVFIQLDRFINGIDTCHATHKELARAETPPGEKQEGSA